MPDLRLQGVTAVLGLLAALAAPGLCATAVDTGPGSLPKVVRVAPDPDFAPVEFFASGQHRGIAADLLTEVAERHGVRFEIVRVSSREAALQAVESGRADLLSSAVVASGPSPKLSYTRPYVVLPLGAWVRAQSPPIALGDLPGLTLALHAAEDLASGLEAHLGENRPERCASLERCLDALAAGEVEVVLADLLSARHALRKRADEDIALAFEIPGNYPVALAAPPRNAHLIEALDAALAGMAGSEEQGLLARWLGTAGAESEASPAIVSEPERLAELEARLAATSDAEDSVRADLEAAVAAEKETQTLVGQHAALLAEAAEFETRIAELESELARNPREDLLAWRATIPQQMSVPMLQSLLEQERTRRISAESRRDAVEQRLKDAEASRASLIARLEGLAQGESASTASEQPANHPARQSLIESRLRRRDAERMLVDQQLALLPSRLHLLALDRRLARRQAEAATSKVAWLERRIEEAAGAEIAALRERIVAELAQAPTDLRPYAEANLAIVERLAHTVADTRYWQATADQLRTQLQETTRSLADTRERLALSDRGRAAIGSLLSTERQRLGDPRELDRQWTRVLERTAEARVLELSLRNALSEDDPGFVDHRLAHLDIDQRESAQKLLGTWSELSDRLHTTNRALLDHLGRAESSLIELRETSREFATLLDRELLWTRSHPTLHGLLFGPAAPALSLPAASDDPAEGTAALRELLAARPWSATAILGLSLLLWALRKHLWRRVLASGQATRSVREDRFGHTVGAIFASVLRVLPGPLLCGLCGWLLRAESETWPHLATLGESLHWSGLLWLMGLGLRELGREDGLGHRHFRFSRQRRQILSQGLTLVVLPMLALVTIGATARLWSPETRLDAIPRLAMIGFELLLALAFWRLFAEGFFRPRGAAADAAVGRAARLIRIGAALGPASLAIAIAAGYVYTAIELTELLLLSAAAMMVVWLGYHLAARALLLGARRLAETRAVSSLASQQDTSGPEGPQIDSGRSQELTLDGVSQQVRALLRYSAALVGGLWLLAIWAEINPALSALDEIKLWSVSRTIDGVQTIEGISLLSILAALLAIVLMVVAARNLPGLLQLILRPLALQPATQYAVTSLCRYAIILIGIVTSLGLLGLEWSKLQWLVAALGVGIGFGLQEIIANFVSGLILLFERPVRVGDTVTIGEFSGTVARIDIRATTLVDWDNREVVVPNKAFLTEKVVNWTLSDTVTRIIIKVGVSYDSPPSLVQQTLLEVAGQQPEVLADPAPMAVLMGFGASTLDFELRCHVARMNERLRASDGLHHAIAQAFRERGITIDYPQLDVHIRRES